MRGERSIGFAWWNVGVAPPRSKPKATLEHRAAVASVIARLIEHEDCGLIALAEVRREPLLPWVPASVRSRWHELRDTTREPHDFDVGLLYDRTRLIAVDHRWLRYPSAGRQVRVGLLASFESTSSGEQLDVAALHWPSNMGDAADAGARRSAAASGLRHAIAELREDAPVLVMGDLNLEPWEEPLCSAFPTSRARDVVVRHRSRRRGTHDVLFYNASWRMVGERWPSTFETGAPSLAGTYRTSAELPTAWRTFDQVLVSSALLDGNAFRLQEDLLGIWPDETVYDADDGRPRRPFDHLPIVGYIQPLTSAGRGVDEQG